MRQDACNCRQRGDNLRWHRRSSWASFGSLSSSLADSGSKSKCRLETFLDTTILPRLSEDSMTLTGLFPACLCHHLSTVQFAKSYAEKPRQKVPRMKSRPTLCNTAQPCGQPSVRFPLQEPLYTPSVDMSATSVMRVNNFAESLTYRSVRVTKVALIFDRT